MPKRPSDYPDRVEAFCPPETLIYLQAIAYHMGARGQVSTPVRNFVMKGVREYVDGLSGKSKKDFEEILGNVKVQMIK